jgi:hypothetical protein
MPRVESSRQIRVDALKILGSVLLKNRGAGDSVLVVDFGIRGIDLTYALRRFWIVARLILSRSSRMVWVRPK